MSKQTQKLIWPSNNKSKRLLWRFLTEGLTLWSYWWVPGLCTESMDQAFEDIIAQGSSKAWFPVWEKRFGTLWLPRASPGIKLAGGQRGVKAMKYSSPLTQLNHSPPEYPSRRVSAQKGARPSRLDCFCSSGKDNLDSSQKITSIFK